MGQMKTKQAVLSIVPNRSEEGFGSIQDHQSIPCQCTDLLFLDAPHLLKTTRNCFSNSFSYSKSRCLMVISLLLNNHSSTVAICILWCILMQKGGENISWKWIESLYLSENTTTTPGVRMCHKLTRDHVWLTPYTRMRLYLAAQVKAI